MTVFFREREVVREVIERFVALLARGRASEALALLLPSKTWTPEVLVRVIRNYGWIDPRKDGKTFAVTMPAAARGAGPRFELRWFDTPHGARVAHASYDLPLEGEWSDVTALFDVLDGPEGLALALDDVHVL